MSHPKGILEEELSCAVCLHLYNDPVSLPCGHSYCQECIRSTQRSEQPSSQPRCPECRKEYSGQEPLLRNFKLSGIVETYRKAMSGGSFMSSTSVVQCDQCLDGVEPAVKTCLNCEASLCEGHLKRHQDHHRSKGHTLVDPLAGLNQRKCPDHLCEWEFLCLHDRCFLCNECMIEGKHNEHEVQMLEAAKSDLVRVVEGLEKATSDRLKMTEALLRRAQEHGKNSGTSTEVLSDQATKLLDNMAAQISDYKDRMRNLLEDELHEYEKTWQASVNTLKEYQQLLTNAQSSANDLLLASPSDFLFLQLYIQQEPKLRQAASVTVPCLPAPQPTDTRHLRSSLGTVAFHTNLTQLIQSLHSLMNPLELSFNPATVHHSLILSTDLLTVKHWGGGRPSFSSGEQSERFATAVQVMCSQALSRGAHMWAVELGIGSMWSIGVCYASIPRKGDHSRMGHNALSWRLQWKNKKLTACHDSISTTIQAPSVPPKRLEVALDYDKGTLAFYGLVVKGRKFHLHTFRATFREPLYPVFGLHSATDESWITLLNAPI